MLGILRYICLKLFLTISASYNCVDRHVANGKGSKVALIHEGNDPEDITHVTYSELQAQVCRLANLLKKSGVRKGDTVAIYMHMTPYLVYAMLACCRIGAIHSVVFAGFSADALSQRMEDTKCKLLITADAMARGPKTINLKAIVDDALAHCPAVKVLLSLLRVSFPYFPNSVQTVLVLRSKDSKAPMVVGRDEDLAASMVRNSIHLTLMFLTLY